MSESEHQAANWTMGLVGSVILHVAVVGIFVLVGGRSAPGEAEPGEPAAIEAPDGREPAPDAGPQPAAPTAATATAAAPSSAPPVPDVDKFYIVKSGDYASKIAKKYDLTLQELAEMNHTTVQKLNGIAVGQKLRVAE